MKLAIIAASAVALSITNAADYISTVPVATNLIQGVGMGSGGAYRALRAEDAEFLRTAFEERLYLSAEPYLGLFDEWGNSGRVPVESFSAGWSNLIDRDYRVSFLMASTNGFEASSQSFGFVPYAWEPWTGFLVSTSTVAWVRNGYDASVDVRAVFGDSSAGLPAASIPTNVIFVGALSLQAMTNAYACLDSESMSTLLRGAEPTADCCTTNQKIIGMHYRSVGYNYTRYTIGSGTRNYLSSVTLGDFDDIAVTNQATVTASSMACYSQRQRNWYTWFGVEYATEPTVETPYPGGTLHVTDAGHEGDYFDESLPGSGDLWLSVVPVVSGWTNVVAKSGTICNTNLTMHAYLVCCWRCTTTDTLRINYGVPSMANPDPVTTNQVKLLLTSHDLGTFELINDIRQSSGRGFVTPNVWRAVATRVHEIQSEALIHAEANQCFKGGFFRRPPVTDKYIPPSDYPATVSEGWQGCSAGSGSAVTTRRNDFAADKVYLLLVIHPTYYARVLD